MTFLRGALFVIGCVTEVSMGYSCCLFSVCLCSVSQTTC